ncbi:hypothetical protein G7Y89_g10882 [Cudoniella acicularis]|uniref:Uncharacterized protein n=1 Tax=Cudoniella acicularis TaxID=354080 RepID=A0A8H4RBX5_9HELO|nr:hypothetical protein G7Y89_g10882 [Cudoniella acicularis]
MAQPPMPNLIGVPAEMPPWWHPKKHSACLGRLAFTRGYNKATYIARINYFWVLAEPLYPRQRHWLQWYGESRIWGELVGGDYPVAPPPYMREVDIIFDTYLRALEVQENTSVFNEPAVASPLETHPLIAPLVSRPSQGQTAPAHRHEGQRTSKPAVSDSTSRPNTRPLQPAVLASEASKPKTDRNPRQESAPRTSGSKLDESSTTSIEARDATQERNSSVPKATPDNSSKPISIGNGNGNGNGSTSTPSYANVVEKAEGSEPSTKAPLSGIPDGWHTIVSGRTKPPAGVTLPKENPHQPHRRTYICYAHNAEQAFHGQRGQSNLMRPQEEWAIRMGGQRHPGPSYMVWVGPVKRQDLPTREMSEAISFMGDCLQAWVANDNAADPDVVESFGVFYEKYLACHPDMAARLRRAPGHWHGGSHSRGRGGHYDQARGGNYNNKPRKPHDLPDVSTGQYDIVGGRTMHFSKVTDDQEIVRANELSKYQQRRADLDREDAQKRSPPAVADQAMNSFVLANTKIDTYLSKNPGPSMTEINRLAEEAIQKHNLKKVPVSWDDDVAEDKDEESKKRQNDGLPDIIRLPQYPRLIREKDEMFYDFASGEMTTKEDLEVRNTTRREEILAQCGLTPVEACMMNDWRFLRWDQVVENYEQASGQAEFSTATSKKEKGEGEGSGAPGA